MAINIPLKWEISTRVVTLLQAKFSRFETRFDDSLEMLTYRQIFKSFFFANKLSHKKYKLVKHKVDRFFRRQHKRQGHADLHTPDMNRDKWVDNSYSYGMRVHSSVVIIAQSDTKKMEYVTG